MPVKKAKPVEKTTLTASERALKCAELAFDKKAFDICVRDISRVSSIADYMVIISGSSDKQNQAIADNIRSGLKKYGKINDIEGASDGKWIVMDYSDVLVHIFHDNLRRYYDLDGLWGLAPELELPAEIKAARKDTDF
ncbi:MAG: ribosome silencing factor [Geobacteraceae bacterium GWC2_55_20]|nr:MAG: ribosome silencing factor [Geobacteraceae bacterium GWC2_55_20]OGU23690.1 MAG: ribosome silencing factor [Geobacteraceae bacterium GWF2_54_21]HBA71574.1 ribosome silencing factor [Geobacter sp.]HCE66356.1 ribosome silencing factor [Geobacter sp.]